MTRSADTSTGSHAAQLAVYRSMSPSARVRAALQMSEEARQLALAGERHRHPDWSEDRIRRAVAESLLPPDLVDRAFAAPPP
jgi:Rv0078B-related antitoxin